MANVIGATRTNYFAVTDANRLRQLVNGLVAEDDITFSSMIGKDGIERFMFGCYDSIGYMEYDENGEEKFEDCYEGYDYFIKEIQKILPDNDAIILLYAGHERLRSVDADACIVTNKKIASLCLSDLAVFKAQDLLGNDNYDTRLQY